MLRSWVANLRKLQFEDATTAIKTAIKFVQEKEKKVICLQEALSMIEEDKKVQKKKQRVESTELFHLEVLVRSGKEVTKAKIKSGVSTLKIDRNQGLAHVFRYCQGANSKDFE